MQKQSEGENKRWSDSAKKKEIIDKNVVDHHAEKGNKNKTEM